MSALSLALLEELQSLDTPTICNALESVVPERRGYGYTTQSLLCLRPELPPVVGVARTATIRAAHPGDLTRRKARQLSDDYYSYIDSGAKPSVIVIQDLDGKGGYGCFWGEVNSAIHRGLGCLGLVTDGAIRDLGEIAPGFQMLAATVLPSHAFVHVVDFGRPVEVAGMPVKDGDLVHADRHGAVVIPHEAAPRLKKAADLIVSREKVLIEAANEEGFDIERLRQALGDAAEIH